MTQTGYPRDPEDWGSGLTDEWATAEFNPAREYGNMTVFSYHIPVIRGHDFGRCDG